MLAARRAVILATPLLIPSATMSAAAVSFYDIKEKAAGGDEVTRECKLG